LQHTDDQILDITMEQMRSDTRYHLAVQSINSELVMRDVYTRTHGVNIFPEHLKLYNLPATVMSYYPKEERSQLFPTDNETAGIVNLGVATEVKNSSTPQGLSELVKAIVNVTAAPTNAQIKLARQGVAENCEGCGMYGHNVFKTGCDKCAQYILIKRFLEKNEDSVKPILSKYRKHQLERSKSRKKLAPEGQKDGKFKHKYNTRMSKSRVKKLQDAMSVVFESSDDSSNNDEEEFSDAKDENESDAELQE
jgi:hypothetical protein